MMCPYCLADGVTENTETRRGFRCSACGERTPSLYVSGYAEFPPLPTVAVGCSAHGKSTYFAALLKTFRGPQLARSWPGFHVLGLDDYSIAALQDHMTRLGRGDLPVATPRQFPRPILLRLAGIPDTVPRTLMLYDVGGETYQDGARAIESNAYFVKEAPAVQFMVSLPDLACDPVGFDAAMCHLLNTYIVGVTECGGDTGRQSLTVVYTKADLLGEYLPGHLALYNYMQRADIPEVASAAKYAANLEPLSELLHDFTSSVVRATNFLTIAASRFRSVRFTMVSSLGAEPTEGKLLVDAQPRRVLDPLLWLLRTPVEPAVPQPEVSVKHKALGLGGLFAGRRRQVAAAR